MSSNHWNTGSRLRGLVLALALLLTPLLGLAATPAHAATLGVTTTNDSGPGSLRQAIADAAPGDTITFALPTPSVITLSSELVIAKDLTISGPGTAALTISGDDATRVLFINPGASGATSGPPATSLAVTISNLTIANGNAKGGDGDRFHDVGGSGGAAGMGGAIFSNNGTLTISGVTFSTNQAQGGTALGFGFFDGGGAGGGGVGGNGGDNSSNGGVGGSGGAFGGSGGAGGAHDQGGLLGTIGGAGGAGGDGAGGGGGGTGGHCPIDQSFNCTGPAGNGGNGGAGGFGGGGGGGGATGWDSTGSPVGGIGGAGGFGGGGGGGGVHLPQETTAQAGGAGGSFGGNGGSSGKWGGQGGGGAGLGGAIFIRAGSLTLADSSFTNNTASGGSGFQNGQGKGGAIFLLSPASLTATGCATLSGNSATDAAGSGTDTNDLYGGSIPPLPACDTTVPVIAATLAGTLGNNDWYTGDVTVNWSVSDPDSAISSQTGCDPSTVTSDTAGVTLTCTATSTGGTFIKSVTIKRDATAPSVTATPDRTSQSNRWYNAPITFSFSGNDGTGSGVTSCDAPKSYSGPDSASASITGNCSDAAGNVGSASASFLYDATAPSVSYAGNSGTYAIDQSVSISCSATDNLSGIASTTCANISGPAYSFALGTNTRSASATDNAGNTGSGSTTFTVGVTFDSLCTLSASFSTDPVVDKGLCDKLAAAKAATAKGDTKTKNSILAAYRQQVAAQSGKAVTKQQATILTNLSKAL